MIVRLFTGADGQSHFEDLNIPERQVETIVLKPGADLKFYRAADGAFSDWHNAPQRQFVIVLSGQMEIGIGGGTLRRLGPGNIVLAEDLTGQGHTTRALGGPRLLACVPLPD